MVMYVSKPMKRTTVIVSYLCHVYVDKKFYAIMCRKVTMGV